MKGDACLEKKGLERKKETRHLPEGALLVSDGPEYRGAVSFPRVASSWSSRGKAKCWALF